MPANTPKKISENPSTTRQGNSIQYVYLVETTSLSDGPATAEAAVVGLGLQPAGYVLDSLTSKHVNRNPLWYQVTITFKTLNGESTTDPLSRPSVLTSSYSESTEPYFKDSTGKMVVNTAGDPFDPMPKIRVGSLILQVTKNMASFPAVQYDTLKYTTNSGAVVIRTTTYAADTLLFLPPTVQEVWESIGGIFYHYFATTFRLAASKDQHKDKLSSRGYRELKTPGAKPTWVTGDDGHTVAQPVGLDSAGKEVAAGGTPDEITFQPYKSTNWGIDFS